MLLCNPYFLSINNNIWIYNKCKYMKEENICLALLYEFLFMAIVESCDNSMKLSL